ncbi:biotin/lipoyl-binding protein [Acutalibacter caecimuris]|uniref:biotin/lipoyl-binding protein n=1 Tax=Acutalibacter caecimuris TaxID=3093657 RepID=UPI002AC8C722|nr:biotin/lipoyl-binding protein [Acutalibacter sp. M00118]
MNNKVNLRKRLIILGITLLILAGIITGVVLYLNYRNDQKTVEVLSLTDYNVSTNYWGDQTSSSGNIVSDFVQEIYPDSSKTISEIFVQEGQTVKVGDPLLQYDRTTLELDMEAKEIAVKQAEVKIDEAQRQLKKLQNTKPAPGVQPTRKPTPTPKPTPKPTPTPTPTPKPTPDVHVYKELTADSIPYKGTGTTEDPYVFLCEEGYTMGSDFLRLLWGLDVEPTSTPTPTSAPTPDATPTPAPTPDDTPEPTATPEPDPTMTPEPETTPEPDNAGSQLDSAPVSFGRAGLLESGLARVKFAPEEDEDEDGFQLTSPFAAVFEVREFNNSQCKLLSSVTLDGTQFTAAFQTGGVLSGVAAGASVANLGEGLDLLNRETAKATPTPTPDPNNYNHMGYTSADLNQAIKEKKQEITRLNLDLKQAKLNLDKSKRALENSTVLSTVDGQVRSLLDLDSAMAESLPFLVVSGAQQYYVSGTLSENLLGSINIGDQVSITAYGMSGMNSYTAQIVSISDFPVENTYYYSSGNSNSSNYEFSSVILDPDDNLQTGNYVEINMNVNNTAVSSDTLYLNAPYFREDDAGYYVMKAGPDNRLVKAYVQLGKSIWNGQAYEIKSGLTPEDYLAFPYSSDAKEGVRVVDQNTQEPPFTEDGEPVESIPDGAGDMDGITGMPDGSLATGPEDASLLLGGMILNGLHEVVGNAGTGDTASDDPTPDGASSSTPEGSTTPDGSGGSTTDDGSTDNTGNGGTTGNDNNVPTSPSDMVDYDDYVPTSPGDLY